MNEISILKKSQLLLSITTLSSAAFMIGFLVAGFLIIELNTELPDAQSIKSVELKVPLRVYSADNLLISEFGDERRKPVAIEEVPPSLVSAILASEDDSFYSHQGIDVSGLIRAALSNFRTGQTRQGASTITMQVARNFFLSPEKTYIRKLKEVLLAIKLEQVLSKDEILSLYLNKIFLGHRAYGFGAAADVYYGKPLEELDLAQVAMLAGLPKAPSSYNPLRNPERATQRRNYVLGRLRDLGKVPEQEYLEAIAAPVTAEKHAKNSDLVAPHIAEMVRAQLTEEFGEEAYWQGLNVYTTILSKQQQAAEKSLRAGLQSYDRRHGFRGPIGRINLEQVEIDPQHPDDSYTQILAVYPNSQEQIPALITQVNEESAVAQTRDYGPVILKLSSAKWAKRHLTANQLGDTPKSMLELLASGDVVYIQAIVREQTDTLDVGTEIEQETQWRLSQIPNVGGALISMEPSSGKILSLIGGYDFFLNKYNRAVQSVRQPGSNIKPFIYSAALDKGLSPASLISGAPIVMTDPAHGTVWRPENYSGKFYGPTRIREALSKSMNLVSVRLLRAISIPYAREYVGRFGIDMSRFSPTLTMALGSGGVTPMEMLGAYSALANGGYKIKPYFIETITDRTGEVIYRAQQPKYCDECYQRYLPQQETEESLELAEDSIVVDQPEIEENVVVEPEQQATSEPEHELTYEAPRVMGQANNFLTVDMMKDVVRRGTARKALVLNRQDLAGKTGTTNDYVDAWFTGFNSKVATTVWIGFDNPATMGRGEAGSVAALPIWIDYMRSGLEGVTEDDAELPEFIEEGFVNRSTGNRVDELDPDAIAEYFVIDALLPEYELAKDPLEEALNSELDALEGEMAPLDDSLETLDEINQEERIIETSEEDTEGLF
ncbi:MAG: penicillin-binding protein 1A [Cryomorphaceae bacterium]